MKDLPYLLLAAAIMAFGWYVYNQRQKQLEAERARLAEMPNSYRSLMAKAGVHFRVFLSDFTLDETVRTVSGAVYVLRIEPQRRLELYAGRAEEGGSEAPWIVMNKTFEHIFGEGDRIEVQSISYDKKKAKEISREQARRGFSAFDRVTDSGFDINLVKADGIIQPLLPAHSRNQVEIANLATRIRQAIEQSGTTKGADAISQNREGFDV